MDQALQQATRSQHTSLGRGLVHPAQTTLAVHNVIRYFGNVKPGKRRSTARKFVDDLAASGRYHFTTSEAGTALGVSTIAARAALRRLAATEAIASPHRGFYVIVPPEYRRLGCLPPEQFIPQLMAFLRQEYYAGLLSAAQLHGAAHQRPQVFQVMLKRNRAPLSCGKVRVEFIARKAIARVPALQVNTPRGPLRLSSVEATALDLVGYAERAGGLDTVATVLAELAGRLDPTKLAEAARLAPVPWAQRLGYLLDMVGAGDKTGPLAEWVHGKAREYVTLAPGTPGGKERSKRWRLLVNASVEVEG